MSRPIRQSALRYPLNGILGTDAHVRIIRELARHGGELSVTSLMRWTKVTAAAIRQSLAALEGMKIVKAVGTGRSRLYRLESAHPLSGPLKGLFLAEERRFDEIKAAVRTAAESCDHEIQTIWLYGSVARGDDGPASDLDVAIVAPPGRAATVELNLRESLRKREDDLLFSASIIALDANDLRRLARENDPWWRSLVRDARPILGDEPETLLSRLRSNRAFKRRKAS